MVTVSFQLPESIEEQLRLQLGDVSAATKEAALAELVGMAISSTPRKS